MFLVAGFYWIASKASSEQLHRLNILNVKSVACKTVFQKLHLQIIRMIVFTFRQIITSVPSVQTWFNLYLKGSLHSSYHWPVFKIIA